MAGRDERLERVIRVLRIPVILVFLALSAASASRIPEIKLDFGFHTFFEHSKDLPALKSYKEKYGEDINLVIVIAKSDRVFTAANLRALKGLSSFLDRQPEVTKVTSLTDVTVIRNVEDELRVEPFMDRIPVDPGVLEALREEAVKSRELRRFLISDDGRVTAVVAELEGHLTKQNRLLAALEGWIAHAKKTGKAGDLAYHLGGVNVIQREYEKTATSNIVSNGVLILGIMGIILLLQYRKITGLLLPVACALVALVLVLGLMVVTGEPVNTVNQLVPELMLILGIADGIYILSRYFEERQRHEPFPALRVTMRHMVVACFFTSLTTAVGFGSLYAADMNLIKRFGIYCAAGVMISYTSTILINASLLSFFRKRGGAAPARGQGRDLTGRCLAWVCGVVLRRQGRIILVSILLLAAAAALVFRINLQHQLLSELDTDNPVVRTNEMFENSLFGVLSYAIEFEGPPESMVEPEVLKKIDGIVALMEKREGVRKTLSLPETLKEFNEKWMNEGKRYYALPKSKSLAVNYLDLLDPDIKRRIVSEDYSATRIMVRTKNLPSSWWYDCMEILKPVLDRDFPPGGSITWRFNGSSHLAAKTLHHLIRDLLSTMVLSIVTITLLMTLLFRSLRIGLISMVPNLIPLALTFGFMGLAGIELRPATAIIFAVSLGIAVNDTIHIMARFREEIGRRSDIEGAVTATIMSAGRPVVYTSVLLIGGYCVLLFSDFIAVKHFSLLITVTLLSALWADLLITPVLLLKAGKGLMKPGLDRPRRS